MDYSSQRLVIGRVYHVTVEEVRPYGAIVRLDDGSTQLIHISNISTQFVKNVEDYMRVGETYTVIGVKGKAHPVELSLKDCTEEAIANSTDTSDVDESDLDFAQLLEQYLPEDRSKYRNSRR